MSGTRGGSSCRPGSPRALQAPVLLALLGLALAEPRPAGAQEAGAAPTVTLEDLRWIAGHWAGDALGGRTEEGWLAPGGDTMSGVFRLVSGERTRFVEFLHIQQTEGEVLYRLRHFGAGMEPWEEEALAYRLTRLESVEGGMMATFDSVDGIPMQNKPRRLVYRRSGDSLVIRVYRWEPEDEFFEVPLALQP